MAVRRNLLLFLPLLLYLACAAWMGANGPIGRGGYPFMAVYLLAQGLMVLLWLLAPAAGRRLWILFAAALAARLLFLPFPVGDDIHRYVWEGKIQNEGFNPYALAPGAPELASLRDANWEGINHKNMPAIYPPGAQLLFRACAGLVEDGRFFRILFVLFDAATILLLLALARAYRVEAKHVLLYALNPLVLLYVAGEGHLDPAYIFFLVAAILAWKKGRDPLAFLLLGTATMVKIIPLAFLPLFVNRKNARRLFVFFVPFLLALPYLEPGASLTAMPGLFMKTFYYNGFLFSLSSLLLPNAAASLFCWAAFGAAALALFFLVPDVFRACYLLAGAFCLCSPAMHQWYFLLILPFLPFFRSPPWILLAAALAATFTTRFVQYETGGWADFAAARLVEYLPFAALGTYLFLKGLRTGPQTFEGPLSTVSVVIPTLDEAGRIEACIDSVASQGLPGTEIIVADGGSGDGTADRVRALPGVRLLEAPRGRGSQIAAAAAAAQGDIVLVLHADTRLEPGALAAVRERLAAAPAAIGGSFTARFEDRSPRLGLIALLDGARAFLTGISFGNQGQFFRRREGAGLVPDYPLMEDVELAFRLKEKGAVITIWGGVKNSARRWKRTSFLGNSLLVLRLTARFVLSRRLGAAGADLDEYRRKYYGLERRE